MRHWTDPWKKLRPLPCKEAWDWAITQPDWQSAWNNCLRADWMLFHLARELKRGSPEHRKMMRVVCQCDRLSLPYAGAWREKLEGIYEKLEKWAEGEEVDLTALRALAATYAAEASANAHAASAAASACFTAFASSYACYAAYSAPYIAFASYSAACAAGDARNAILAEMANIVRQAYPIAP